MDDALSSRENGCLLVIIVCYAVVAGRKNFDPPQVVYIFRFVIINCMNEMQSSTQGMRIAHSYWNLVFAE